MSFQLQRQVQYWPLGSTQALVSSDSKMREDFLEILRDISLNYFCGVQDAEPGIQDSKMQRTLETL